MSAALQLAKTEMSDLEWQTRCDLAALYHVINHLGWTDLINTHMTARIPDEPNTFLINNYGEMFVVPKGVEHCPIAHEETHVLLIEPTGTPNTGDVTTAAPRQTL